jgi:hypothetical protein
MLSDGLHVESARSVAVAQLNMSLFLLRPTAAVSNSEKLKIILFERTSLTPDLHGLSLMEKMSVGFRNNPRPNTPRLWRAQ